MRDPNANANANDDYLIDWLFSKVGEALELAATTEESDEEAYWLGMADMAIELISEETGASYVEIKAEVTVAFDELSLADRVNEVFGE